MHSSRHFLVKRIGNSYHLREIDSLLAHSILLSGTFPYHTHCDPSGSYWFYLVHTPLNCQQAAEVMGELVNQIHQKIV